MILCLKFAWRADVGGGFERLAWLRVRINIRWSPTSQSCRWSWGTGWGGRWRTEEKDGEEERKPDDNENENIYWIIIIITMVLLIKRRCVVLEVVIAQLPSSGDDTLTRAVPSCFLRAALNIFALQVFIIISLLLLSCKSATVQKHKCGKV